MAEAVDALRPEKFLALASDKICLIHKKLLPDMELREVNQSLEIAVDALQERLTNSTLTHFQLMKVLLQKNDNDYKPIITALARTAATMGSCKTWTGFWTGFWIQLYYVIGQCKHGVTVHV